MSIEKRIDELIEKFTSIDDWEERYKLLISMGRGLPKMDAENQVDENKVKGCQSQVWLSAELKDGKIYYEGDSDASIVKGIVALLLSVYSGSTLDEVLNTKPNFLETIGLKEHLSMSRANGLNSMMKQIVLFAYAFKVKMGANS